MFSGAQPYMRSVSPMMLPRAGYQNRLPAHICHIPDPDRKPQSAGHINVPILTTTTTGESLHGAARPEEVQLAVPEG